MTHKIALITGGSRGLGKNTALHLARKGVDSIITYRSQQAEADQVVQEIQKLGGKAVALQLDTGHLKSFAEFASQLDNALNTTWSSNHFDYLVNNAGMGIYNSLAETTEEQFDELMNVHFKGVFFLTQKLLPLMRDGGRIINLSSGLARFSFPGYGAYASMKGAIEVYSRYLAQELGSRQITVNVVAPGAIETDFGGGAVRDNPEVNKRMASMAALGRTGVPDDIGAMIASLLSDDNRWINAQRIEVSGGTLI